MQFVIHVGQWNTLERCLQALRLTSASVHGRRFRGRDEKSRTFKKVGVSPGGGKSSKISRFEYSDENGLEGRGGVGFGKF
jgi:hypothetical protein